MKKYLFSVIIILCCYYKSFGQNTKNDATNDVTIEGVKKLGLLSYLTTVKFITEYKMISLASSKEFLGQKEKGLEFVGQYNYIRLLIDRFINQVSADMTLKNRLKLYKVLNKYIKDKNKNLPIAYKEYQRLIEEIDGKVGTFILQTYSSTKGGNFELTMSVVELAHTIITNSRDFREKKIQSLILIIEKTKLESVKNLIDVEKDKE